MWSSPVAYRVAQKELVMFFSSPVAWIFLASFAAATLFVFFWVESFFSRNIADVRPLFEWMPLLLLFLCAALTMRLWSEERSSGTLEHVLTQPVSLWHFVIGKFWACLALVLLALVSTVPLPITVALIANLDWGPVIGGYVASVLLGAMYLSIGLFVSAHSNNPVVSLITTLALCLFLYLLGSATFTSYFDDRTGYILRLLGSGARFDAITRGVLDLRDLFYYFSMTTAFLSLNVYALEKVRRAQKHLTKRQQILRRTTVLILCNLLLANLWLGQLAFLRFDITQGQIYSISASTRAFLKELQEPLLIRGYFSRKSHPLLAPLVPQLRDLLQEYETAGDGRVHVEFIDPATDPELELEANDTYGITSTPFRTADRHQSSLVNAYFSVLVRYGGEHRALGFSDLIEVRTTPNQPTEVLLRDPEYNLTSAVKNVLFDYHSGGGLFEGVEAPIELIGYVSADELLPDHLRDYKNAIIPQIELAARNSNGKFSMRFIEPESRNGEIAAQIKDRWGFKPMVLSPGEQREFFFYLTLADATQVVQLPTGNFDPAEFRLALDAGLKRFTSDFTKVVALALPPVDPQMTRFHIGGPTFANLERAIKRDYSVRLEDLSDGSVTPDADILAVMAPRNLDARSVFAIDQFLMRGGTVVLATSPFSAELSGGELRLQEWNSGLQDWLEHHGLEIERTLVLDEQNARFTAPVARRSGEHEFRDALLLDYPYFIDVRPPGLAAHPVTRNLPQLTMAWASPIQVHSAADRSIHTLLQSSSDSWLSDSKQIMPTLDEQGLSNFKPTDRVDGTQTSHERDSRNLGVIASGRFISFFAGAGEAADTSLSGHTPTPPGVPSTGTLLEHSVESARIVLFSSNDFMSDQVLKSIVAASGTQYLGALELFINTLDWALQDEQLLDIRSRGHFNRTLPPMDRQVQQAIEYINYGLAMFLLLLLAICSWLQGKRRRRKLARALTL